MKCIQFKSSIYNFILSILQIITVSMYSIFVREWNDSCSICRELEVTSSTVERIGTYTEENVCRPAKKRKKSLVSARTRYGDWQSGNELVHRSPSLLRHLPLISRSPYRSQQSRRLSFLF